jgi:hypothetical protein
MNKQEEIREVIDTYTDDGCLFPDRSCNALGSGYCSSDEEAYKCLMQRLDKIGVVIKVDRELPKCECCEGAGLIGGSGINDCCPECNGTGKMYCAGYVATEPLVKDD